MIRPFAFRVFVAGGGVAGLEALLAPRDLAGARVELTLLRQASLRGDADRERFAARRAEARGKTRRTGLAPDVQSRRTTGGK